MPTQLLAGMIIPKPVKCHNAFDKRIMMHGESLESETDRQMVKVETANLKEANSLRGDLEG
jgi:hypothetical protein